MKIEGFEEMLSNITYIVKGICFVADSNDDTYLFDVEKALSIYNETKKSPKLEKISKLF